MSDSEIMNTISFDVETLPHLEGWRVVSGQLHVSEWVIAESPTGERVAILGYAYEHKGRLVALGTIPIGVGHGYVDRRKVPVITVANKHGPKALAHAIKSQLMPQLRPLWAKWQRKATDSNCGIEQHCEECGDFLPQSKLRLCPECYNPVCLDCWPCCVEADDE